jgi:hypothetical protein
MNGSEDFLFVAGNDWIPYDMRNRESSPCVTRAEHATHPSFTNLYPFNGRNRVNKATQVVRRNDKTFSTL